MQQMLAKKDGSLSAQNTIDRIPRFRITDDPSNESIFKLREDIQSVGNKQ
ncbi:MAG: hypothetical protein ACKVQJ_07095 [Pyrinomonadaceae bacterium]